MKKLFISFVVLFIGLLVFAADNSKAALKFIKSYINAANNYSSNLSSFYDPNAKIIRIVEKKDGTTARVITDTDEYMKQIKIGSIGAKMTNYKNTYTNLKVIEVNDGYKITALRQPSGESYRLPVYFIVKKDENGNWKIIEESMNTKVQKFLKYAK